MNQNQFEMDHPELRLIASFIQDAQSLDIAAEKGLQSKHFSIPEAADVYSMIVNANADGLDFDEATLLAYCNGNPDKINYVKFLGTCLRADNVPYFVDTVIKSYIKTTAQKLLLDVSFKLENMRVDNRIEDVSKIFTELTCKVDDLNPCNISAGTTFEVAISDFWEDVKNLQNKGIASTLPTVNEHATGGWHKGSMITIGGVSGVGKTTFAIQEAIQAQLNGHKVMFFTTEMSPKQLAAKMIANIAAVPFQTLVSDKIFEDGVMGRVKFAEKQMSTSDNKLFFDLGHNAHVETICDVVTKNVHKGQCDLAIVDYVQILSCADNKNFRGNRLEELKDICMKLKLCALKNKIPVIVLAQLNREAENKIDLKMEHIADSSYVARFSDFVLLLNRKQDKNGFRYGYHVVKNRFGPQYSYPMLVDLKLGNFKEHNTQHDLNVWFADEVKTKW